MEVVLLESLKIPEEELAQLVKPLTDRGCTFTAYQRSSVEEQKKQAQNADIVMIANMPLTAEVIESCKNLKMIDIAFTGIDHVDVQKAKSLGVTVCNAAGYSTSTVAELTIGMMISLLRKVRENEARCRGGLAACPELGTELGSKTVGIVGTGAIGLSVAKLCHAFGCRVIAYAPRKKDVPDYVKYVPLPDLMAQADVISLHCPMNAETKGLIGQKELAGLKKGAILVNAARGGVVDTQAVADALTNGKLAGAAIDVFETEPPLATDHPLLSAPNVLATPHIAYASQESMSRRAKIVFDNVLAFLDGHPANVK
ncbi:MULTISPECIES: NAD(P)-dependent oxidoreductase [Anaerotruncus]|jgi:phosphoglycerate dehydrogenase-like enzyme|uniref:NAD(P)-dependent oxidoreductase n=3 Tax=Oscillospiraceae TaxID=216572 RepID=UPI00082E49D3|nr:MULTISPECIES: NAD(P)-dependent oxidoreductase [Anaerotruncus]RGX54781.1 hydroxyacid dehydrogenase [Anaerotruncus sp. AF02-27]